MSIRDAINSQEADGELFHLPSVMLGEEAPRTVYVSLEVAELVLWGPAEGREGRLSKAARALLDGFVEGDYVTIGEDPFNKESTCILARVAPATEEIWDFRCLDPNPGVRILGAFSEQDTFIALTWDHRDAFADNWNAKIEECKLEWSRLFGSLPRLKGNNASEYVSYNFRVV